MCHLFPLFPLPYTFIVHKMSLHAGQMHIYLFLDYMTGIVLALPVQ